MLLELFVYTAVCSDGFISTQERRFSTKRAGRPCAAKWLTRMPLLATQSQSVPRSLWRWSKPSSGTRTFTLPDVVNKVS